MIAVPYTYSEWSNVLAIFKEKTNDTDILLAMQAGTIEWQSGVAERFSKKLIDAVNFRIDVASNKFNKEMLRNDGSEREIIQAILVLRKEMKFLAQAVNLPALPEKERQYYLKLVLEQANIMQNSLEDLANSDRTGKLSSIIRNHKINTFYKEKNDE